MLDYTKIWPLMGQGLTSGRFYLPRPSEKFRTVKDSLKRCRAVLTRHRPGLAFHIIIIDLTFRLTHVAPSFGVLGFFLREWVPWVKVKARSMFISPWRSNKLKVWSSKDQKDGCVIRNYLQSETSQNIFLIVHQVVDRDVRMEVQE